MLRSTLRLLVMGMVVFFLFGEEQGQSYECEYTGYDCQDDGCGTTLPAAPTSRYRMFTYKCCLDGDGDFFGTSCYEYAFPSGSCC